MSKNRDPQLKMEEFLEQRNNFHLHFVTGEFGDGYRNQPAYRVCLENRPALAELTADLLGLEGSTSPVFHYKLYRAYRLMWSFATTNEELFR